MLESHIWTDLLAMYETQLFLNRFHSAMAAQISANGGVPNTMVAMWETEFESLKPLLVRYDTGPWPTCSSALCRSISC